MTKTNAPTLEDVAKLAGVSTASISRALNNPDKVAEGTRHKIEAAIDNLGYTPNFGGRALASSRTNTVGAVIPSIANAMFANGLQAFQEALDKEGFTLLVATTDFDTEQEFRQIKSLVGQGADALMLIGNARPKSTWDFIDKRNVAHIVSWCTFARPGQHFVGFDNAKAAGNAARRVLEMGHRKIALVNGLTAENDRAKARRDGVWAAVNAYEDEAVVTYEVDAPYKIDSGAEALSKIMDQKDKPTAILCATDALAAGAMMRARELGIDVPRELSFVGFDDVGIARVVTPALSTVRVPQQAMGEAAAQLLLQKISRLKGLTSKTLETEFIHRASLVPPPGKPSAS